MLYIPKIDDYSKILPGEKVKHFVAINFSKYFRSVREEQNLIKVAKSLDIFLTTTEKIEKNLQSNSSDDCVHHYNVEILNLFDPELQLINNIPVIKKKLKEMLSELKKFKVQTILVLDYKKRNDCKIFHSSAKLIASASDIDVALLSIYQSIMTKIKNYTSVNCIILNVIIKHSIENFER